MAPLQQLMAKQSAGLVLYRGAGKALEVLLVHPGGPFFAKKDKGVWSIPKGEFTDGEQPEAAAWREFAEELGMPAPEGAVVSLGSVKQKGGKTVYAWAIAGDLDPALCKSNTFTMEWPPRSGQQQEFPEVDRVGWFTLAVAAQKLTLAQTVFLDRLAEHLGVPQSPLPEQASLF